MPIFWLSDHSVEFPDPAFATPEGVLALGGDLSPSRLLHAYGRGIFPWFNPGDPIVWWSPDPRFVLFPDELKVAKSMRPYFNQKKFRITYDHCFEEVILACSESRKDSYGEGTWITDSMIEAYVHLHELGYAHSVEVWKGKELVGGLYGIALGKCFFGESMFAEVSNASKFGFISLVRELSARSYRLIDCQQETGHLASLGARSIPRVDFLDLLRQNRREEIRAEHWNNWAD
jgi:leucyl/phenylalanyl-tRNA--protein transferase